VPLLGGFTQFWTSDGANDLHGSVVNASVLKRNDQLAVWINNNATKTQRFHVKGTESGKLPLVQKLINSTNGTTGAFVSTSAAKAAYSYPRPYLATDPTAAPVKGDAAGCAPSVVNGSSLTSIRVGQSYTDAKGNLNIQRVANATDTTHQFSPHNVALSAGYGTTGLCTTGLCTGGSFRAGTPRPPTRPGSPWPRCCPSSHRRSWPGRPRPATTASSSASTTRSTSWPDATFRAKVLQPARTELVKYLPSKCGASLLTCMGREKPYTDNPYGGKSLPGERPQIVTNRSSALSVYPQRLTYGFPATGSKLAPSVPSGAGNLLLTTFPTLTAAQRTSVLAQTEIRSGYPLDGTRLAGGSWERPSHSLRGRLPGEDEPLAAVDQLAGGVQVAGVGGGLGDHVQDGAAQRPGREVAEEVGPPLRHRVDRRRGDDRVGPGYLVPVQAEDLGTSDIRRDLPRLVPGRQRDRLTRDGPAEPELLDFQGEVPDHAQGRPGRRQHRPPQVVLGQSVQRAEHVLALFVQHGQQRVLFVIHHASMTHGPIGNKHFRHW
jgi:hypothetical protein